MYPLEGLLIITGGVIRLDLDQIRCHRQTEPNRNDTRDRDQGPWSKNFLVFGDCEISVAYRA